MARASHQGRTTRRATGVGAVAAALVAVATLVGCGSGSTEEELSETVPLPDGIQACDEVFAADAAIQPETFGEACSQGEEIVVPRPLELQCTDDRVLVWNTFAWGYEGQPMTLLDTDTMAPEEQEVIYEAAVECLQSTGAAGAGTDTATGAGTP